MFRHPAKKLKWTSYLTVILCAGAGAAGAYLLWQRKQTPAAAAALIGGLILAWIAGLAVYGFGELIEKTKDNNYLLSRIASHTKDLQSMDRSRDGE